MDYWLPEGKFDYFVDISKKQPPPPGFIYATPDHFINFLWAAIGITMLRVVLDFALFYPIARLCTPLPSEHKMLKFKHKVENKAIEKLEKFAKSTGKVLKTKIEEFAQKNEIDPNVVEDFLNYANKKKSFERKLRMKHKKFAESLFKFSFYVIMWSFTFGLFNKEHWFYDFYSGFKDFPYTPSPVEMHYIYYIQNGIYLHFMVFQFIDVKRSDFWEMFIHHVSTCILISYSFYSNLLTVGILVLVVHDCADIFLELAKLFNYMEIPVLPDITFGVFAITFFVSRLVIYPRSIVYPALTKTQFMRDMYPGFMFIPYFLCVLVFLHAFWMFLILSMIYRLMIVGKVEKDIRSESEAEDN
jgi:ceramide synthetase